MNFQFSLPQFIIGLLLALLVSLAAHRLRTLSLSGALAAAVLGTVFFGLGGWNWAVLLLGFFISSSALSRLFGHRKAYLNEKFSKGSQRDAAQVLANGGVAGLFVLLSVFFPGSTWPWFACAGSLAAVNADTWATELGVLSRQQPRMITTFKRVECGTSGGISPGGTLAALGGAGFIAILAVLSGPGPGGKFSVAMPILVALAGLGGSLVDSVLGATVQAIYFCPACPKETERYPLHKCGTSTRLVRGQPWFDNDWVNVACALTGAVGVLAAASLVA